MAKALFQIPGTLIFQTDGYFYKNGYFFPFYWSIDDVIFVVFLLNEFLNLCIGNYLIYTPGKLSKYGVFSVPHFPVF